MKRPLLSLLLTTSLAATGTVSAQETFFGTLEGDLVYNNGVLLQGVEVTAEGKAEITLEGTGTLTAANAAGGGFPRVMVVGGTKITSTRTFAAEETNRTTWSGQFDAPASAVKPGFFDINDPGPGFATDYEAVEAYGMGLSNEEFTFSPAATVVFPVSEQNGQKLYLANEKTDATWDIDDTVFCIVDNNLCSLDIAKINNISLIKEKFETCPITQVQNGSVGTTPGCIISCATGFKLNEDANGCVEDGGVEEFENQFEETTSETSTTEQQVTAQEQIAAPVKEYNFPPGHFRYRTSGDNFYRYFNNEGLEGDVWVNQNADPAERNVINMQTEAGQVRAINTSYLSRNPRSAEEQISAQQARKSAEEKAEDEADFMKYLITMRNYFGDNAQENNFTAMSAESSTAPATPAEGGETAEEGGASTGSPTEGGAEGGEFLSSGPLLPSTGPGIFITIAVVGFALMMFGARRS